jgi:hypothetical protein
VGSRAVPVVGKSVGVLRRIAVGVKKTVGPAKTVCGDPATTGETGRTSAARREKIVGDLPF